MIGITTSYVAGLTVGTSRVVPRLRVCKDQCRRFVRKQPGKSAPLLVCFRAKFAEPPGNHQPKLSQNGIVGRLGNLLEIPWGPLVPSMAIPWGLLVPFGTTGRAFGDQMGSSWAKPGTKNDPNLSQNVIQDVTKSKAEIRSNFGCDLGAYVGQKI